MSVAAVLIRLAPSAKERPGSGKRRSGPPREQVAAEAAFRAGYQDVIAVVSDVSFAGLFPDEATVLLDRSGVGEAAALQAALDWSARAGHEAVTVGLLDASPGRVDPLADIEAWQALQTGGNAPIRVIADADAGGLVRLDASAWAVVPLEGSIRALLASRPELIEVVQVARASEVQQEQMPTVAEFVPADEDDVKAVEALLGRPVAGAFEVVVRDRLGGPVVIRNAPFLDDGTPMPTRYWLVGRRERELVGRLESAGGVDQAEAEVDPQALVAAHARYAAERDRAIPRDHVGPLPSGGVGGTRTGVKCLHADLAWYLAGGEDPVGRWVVDHIGSELPGGVAAIDCGTNSTRLLIVDTAGRTLERQMTITRLGASVDETGELAPDAIERTIEALRRYRAVMDHRGVVDLRATATSAARDASNSASFFDRAEAVLGKRPELLSGLEEGRLSYLGATGGLGGGGPYLVCDLGGGSTELVAGDASGEVAGVRSLDVGCVRITERFLSSDPPSKDELDRAREYVRTVIEAAVSEVPALRVPMSLVGVAGTVSTLVGLRLGLDHYGRDTCHHQHLTRDEVEELLARLASTPAARRRSMPGIEAGRADVIVGGALILAEVMNVLDKDSLIYSEDDILDGLAASLLSTRK